MRQKIFVLSFCLAALFLVACGRFDVSIAEPTPVPGTMVADSNPVAGTGTGSPGQDTTPSPVPTEAYELSTQEPATSSASEEPLATPEATERPTLNQPDSAGEQADDGNDQSGQQVSVCTVRSDWPLYTVRSGDTLFRIARSAGATVDQLVTANCLSDPDRLDSGQRLRVPQLPVETPGPTPTPQPEPWLRYDDDLYQVSFDYPAAWRDVSQDLVTKLAGEDGWVQLGAVGAPADLDTVAQDQAFHKLQPFGSSPVIESLTLNDGRPARLILPSADQPASLDGQSMIVTPYAEPVPIASYPHNYLLLTADAGHIRDIGATLTLPPPTADIFIEEFTVADEDLPNGGKRLTFRWQARGANRGTITSGTHRRFIPWWPVESAGELTVDIASTVFPDPMMTLRMVNDVSGQEATATAIVSWACEYDYFFQPPPQACPLDAALVVDGAYQPFERGFMIWLPKPDLEQPSIYVFTDDGRLSLYPDTWTAGDPGNALDETPPEGLFEPVGGFAKVWREHPSVREDLGWGTAKEFLYRVTYQAERRESIPGIAYLSRPDGSIVRLMDTTWQAYVPGQDLPGAGGPTP